jgi:hypothetical protein
MITFHLSVPFAFIFVVFDGYRGKTFNDTEDSLLRIEAF